MPAAAMEAGPYDPANNDIIILKVPAICRNGGGALRPRKLEAFQASITSFLLCRNGGGALRPRKPRNVRHGPATPSCRNGGGALRPRKPLSSGAWAITEPQWRRGLTTPQTPQAWPKA